MSTPIVPSEVASRDALFAHIESFESAMALESIMSSAALPNVRSILEGHRDFARDLGTHGIGVMAGKPKNDPQRVRARELERCLTLLLGVLELGK